MKNTDNQLPVYKFSSFSEAKVIQAFELEQELNIEGYLTDWIAKTRQINITETELKQLKYLTYVSHPTSKKNN